MRTLGRRRLCGSDPLSLLAAIADTFDEAVIGLAADGMVVLWNAAAESVSGRNAAEILGSPATACVPKQHRKELEHLLSQTLNERRTVLWYGRLLGKGGDPVPAWVTLCPVWDEMERVRGAVMVVRLPRPAHAEGRPGRPDAHASLARSGAGAAALQPHMDGDLLAALDQALCDMGSDSWPWHDDRSPACGAPEGTRRAGHFPYRERPPRDTAHETPGELGEVYRAWSGFHGFFN